MWVNKHLKHPSLLLATYWRQALKSGLYFNLNFSNSCNWKTQNSLLFSHFQFLLISPFDKIWPVRKRPELFRILIFLFKLWVFFCMVLYGGLYCREKFDSNLVVNIFNIGLWSCIYVSTRSLSVFTKSLTLFWYFVYLFISMKFIQISLKYLNSTLTLDKWKFFPSEIRVDCGMIDFCFPVSTFCWMFFFFPCIIM